jgi:hypothetical protein
VEIAEHDPEDPVGPGFGDRLARGIHGGEGSTSGGA